MDYSRPEYDSNKCARIWNRTSAQSRHKAFDAALKWELHEVIQEAKQMASRIRQSSERIRLRFRAAMGDKAERVRLAQRCNEALQAQPRVSSGLGTER